MVPEEIQRQDPYGSVKITSWGKTVLNNTSLWIYFHSGNAKEPREDVWITAFETDHSHIISNGQLFASIGELGGTFEAAFTFDMDRNAQLGDVHVRAVVRSTSCNGVEHYAEDNMVILPHPAENVEHQPLVIYALTYSEDAFNRKWTAHTNREIEAAWERLDWYYGNQPVGHTINNTLVTSKAAGANQFRNPSKMVVRGIEIRRGKFTGLVLTDFTEVGRNPLFAP